MTVDAIVGSIGGAARRARTVLAHSQGRVASPSEPFSGATLRGLVGGTNSCPIGAQLGEKLDRHVLTNNLCLVCGHQCYLPGEKAILLEDGVSRAAFFELTPIDTEGRDPAWLRKARDVLENALLDSFDELETSPWVVQP
jgi:hypothetical protein